MTPYISRIEDCRSVDATKDCLKILNDYKKSKWKRTSKFTLDTGYSSKNTFRVFTDGSEYVTIVDIGGEVLMCKNLDLQAHRPMIDKITILSKNYYTHDYGEVYYNPWDKKVWVSGGDGGIYYNDTLSPQQVSKKFENEEYNDIEDPKTPYFHEKLPELQSSQFEAEYSPCPYHIDEQDEEEMNYIQIGCIRTFD